MLLLHFTISWPYCLSILIDYIYVYDYCSTSLLRTVRFAFYQDPPPCFRYTVIPHNRIFSFASVPYDCMKLKIDGKVKVLVLYKRHSHRNVSFNFFVRYIVFPGKNSFGGGGVFCRGDVFCGRHVLGEGVYFRGGVFCRDDVFCGGSVFCGGDVFGGIGVFCGADIFGGGGVFCIGDVFCGVGAFCGGDVFGGGRAFCRDDVFC